MTGDKVAILLVNDRPEDLLVLKSVLSSDRLELVTACSGLDALRCLLERDFALIILDVVMPGMNGFELASLIRKRERSAQTPILFLTGNSADITTLYRAYALGAVDYLVKPVDPEILKAKASVFVQLFEKDARIREQALALVGAERRNRELELEQERMANARRYRNLADAIPQIVWTTDAAGHVTFWNRRWNEYLGPDGGSSHKESSIDLVHPDDRSRCVQNWQQALERGTPFEIECRLCDASGNYRWHLGRALPEKSPQGELIGWLGTHTDLDDLMRARRSAESAVQARDEFLSVASHELRTPLSALVMQLGSLQQTVTRAPEPEPKVQAKVASALKQTKRLTQLVDNLLDISRLGSKRLALELEECDLSELVLDVAERFGDEANQAGCKLILDAPTGVTGRWDRLRVEQVVTNLLSNAIKYGRGHPVEMRVGDHDGSAEVVVHDSGIGIAKKDQKRIFQQFERAASVRSYGGLGIGLFIASEIVKAHGGGIFVESQPGAGATFKVSLPTRPRSAAGSEPPAMSSEAI